VLEEQAELIAKDWIGVPSVKKILKLPAPSYTTVMGYANPRPTVRASGPSPRALFLKGYTTI
jgi:hypothetical protein